MERMRTATDEEVIALNKQNILLSDAINTADGLTDTFTEIEEVIDDINSKTNFVGKLADGIKEIPALGPLLSGPLENFSKGIAQINLGFDETLSKEERVVAELEMANNVMDGIGKGALAFLIKETAKIKNIERWFCKLFDNFWLIKSV